MARDGGSGKGSRPASKLARWQERQLRSRLNKEEIRKQKEVLAALREELTTDNLSAVTESRFKHFNQLPLSERTLLGLERANYKRMTPIQSDALPLALSGYDVLGAAKTGSGKTLCFVLPVLERLYLEHWSNEDGVGALVLSPTRELALQIFKVLQVVGYKHVLSAALLTGGRDVGEEKKRLQHINIVIGTPGRVLHHLTGDSNVMTDNLQILVMDEADRLLDMGFRESITAIIENLPTQRQTLLFSATQTTDVQMLAQMSLKDPRYVATHAMSRAPTPSTMCQNFMIVELHHKLDVLLMFLKRHPNDKIVVFVSTCNQVKFMYQAFSRILKKMRIPSMCLTGKMKQFRREEVFLTFCRCKSAVLFCTDIAARGLDFPQVHWVIQYDCPDSAQTYIHRAGRTARCGARGVCLLLLTPSETPMLSYLAHKRVPLREIMLRPQFVSESKEIFVSLVVQGLKYDAQKAFIAYLRSLYFASNKHVFQVSSVDVEKFAHSLGLLVVPDMSELQRYQRGGKNLPWDVVNYMASRGKSGAKTEIRDLLRHEAPAVSEDEEKTPSSDDEAPEAPTATRSRREKHLAASDMFRMMEQKQKYAPKGPSGFSLGEVAEDDDDEFLVKKVKPISQKSTDTSVEERQLTFDERMAGLSKNKIRKFVETADLRVKDLGLTRVQILSDDDSDDDMNHNSGTGGTSVGSEARRVRATVIAPEKLSARAAAGRVDAKRGPGQAGSDECGNEVNGSGPDEEAGNTMTESDSDEMDYATRLRRRLEKEKESDTLRNKRLRRGRQLKREGRLTKKEQIAFEKGISLGKRKDGSDGSGSDDNEYASDVSDSSSLQDLLRAARGELYSDSDGDDCDAAEAEVESDESSPPVKKQRR